MNLPLSLIKKNEYVVSTMGSTSSFKTVKSANLYLSCTQRLSICLEVSADSELSDCRAAALERHGISDKLLDPALFALGLFEFLENELTAESLEIVAEVLREKCAEKTNILNMLKKISH